LLQRRGGLFGTEDARRPYLGERGRSTVDRKIELQVNPRQIMNALPVDRALAIYGTIANRPEQKGARARLSQHLRKVFLEGEHDPHRLTVHGLSYLQDLDRARDS
jgi:hypothetical protein